MASLKSVGFDRGRSLLQQRSALFCGRPAVSIRL